MKTLSDLDGRQTTLDLASAPSLCVLDVIGGNVDNSVSMKRIPVSTDGRLATSDGSIVDRDYPWFIVIRVNYDSG